MTAEEQRLAQRRMANTLYGAARFLVMRAAEHLEAAGDPSAPEAARLATAVSGMLALTYDGKGEVFACRR